MTDVCMNPRDYPTYTWTHRLDTVIEPDAKRVRTGGDRRLAAILVNRLHETLFGVRTG